MASVVDLENSERSKIVSLCVDFLGESWNRVNSNDIVCQRINTGFGNRNYYCSIKNCSAETSRDNEYKEVVVRLFKSDLFKGPSKIKYSGQTAEPVIIQRLSDVGIAPKLLGVFDGGVIVEYIPSKVATVEDLASLEVSKAIVRKLAKFHLQSMPIAKKPNLIEMIETNYMSMEGLKMEEVKHQFPKDYLNDLNTILEFPWKEEFEWLKAATPKVGHKVVFSHNDLNPHNILLKEQFTSVDDQTVLIDYECSTYFYRGYDIAGFLRYRNMKLKSDGNKIECTFEENKDCVERELLEEYLLESKKLNGGESCSKYDNLERLEMETYFFQFVLDLFMMSFCCSCVYESKIQLPLNGCITFAKTYKQRKEKFLEKYGNPTTFS